MQPAPGAQNELLDRRIRDARQRLNESFVRTLEASTQDFGDPLFAALYEEHCCDREAVVSAMQELEMTRE